MPLIARTVVRKWLAVVPALAKGFLFWKCFKLKSQSYGWPPGPRKILVE
jgi:hypothetical protein